MEETRQEKALRLHCAGSNCAQAVLCTFADVIGMDETEAARLAAPFGGGMGRLREVCGAVSAMFMVLGMKEGYVPDTASDKDKSALYVRVRALAEEYRAENGSILCRELLEKLKTNPAPALEAGGRKGKPCSRYVLGAVELIEREIRP